ncbi:hypothetical protein [Sphingomonas hengshuiensis]|uniref:hypothetical protein n=1 Tax=Sphingomonas hengshuiensis TaxID=1609977 RepID=UPI0012B8CB72|nr:hypothetical protein [Sphingomonas hengshuiensis]
MNLVVDRELAFEIRLPSAPSEKGVTATLLTNLAVAEALFFNRAVRHNPRDIAIPVCPIALEAYRPPMVFF